MELIVLKLSVVGLEVDISAILVLRGFCHIADEFATFKGRLAHLSVTIAMHLEMTAQCIDGLDTDTVQSDRLLECFRVELTTGIENTYRLDEFALRDASAIVANGDTQIVFHIHLDTFASLHLKLIDRVVEHFFQQHVDTILSRGTVAESANIHTRAQTDMLQTCQGLYITLVIFYSTVLFNDILLFTHILLYILFL